MDFEELVTVWYEKARHIFKETQSQNLMNLGRIFGRVRQ